MAVWNFVSFLTNSKKQVFKNNYRIYGLINPIGQLISKDLELFYFKSPIGVLKYLSKFRNDQKIKLDKLFDNCKASKSVEIFLGAGNLPNGQVDI